ncbi:MAG: hypothetical protein LBR61_12215 [Synergistaceae bacterium]|jgi:hypothetical protein|nr:hypothetical protein [Synergistaceae bacterium]
MSDVEYVIGSENISNIPMQTYSDDICRFVEALSEKLTKFGDVRRYPDVAALAFWCRKGNIGRLKADFGSTEFRLGRGLCFHVAPSNIPVNFAFSWLFALLAGNASVVRLPGKEYPQIEIICNILRGALRDFPEIEERTAFVRYPAQNEITAKFCEIADARMIWGGDGTVTEIRGLRTKPRCVDLTFADRYSLCVINGKAILDTDENGLSRLAEHFFNDTWLMDQNACSSPQLILWINDSEEARGRFWDAALVCASERYELQTAVAVEKYARMCEDALELETLVGVRRDGNLLYRAELKALRGPIENLRGRGGYFYEYRLKNLDELAAVVTDKYQTLTQFGMNEDELRGFVLQNRLRGIDRVVPVGRAMDIDVVWDGFDIVRMLSRVIA